MVQVIVHCNADHHVSSTNKSLQTDHLIFIGSTHWPYVPVLILNKSITHSLTLKINLDEFEQLQCNASHNAIPGIHEVTEYWFVSKTYLMYMSCLGSPQQPNW